MLFPFWDIKHSHISNHKEQVESIGHVLRAICYSGYVTLEGGLYPTSMPD
jgi:hypothetical protein